MAKKKVKKPKPKPYRANFPPKLNVKDVRIKGEVYGGYSDA